MEVSSLWNLPSMYRGAGCLGDWVPAHTNPTFPHTPQKHCSRFPVTGKALLQSNWLYSFDYHWENWQSCFDFCFDRKFRVKAEDSSSPYAEGNRAGHIAGNMEQISMLTFLALFFYPNCPFALVCLSIWFFTATCLFTSCCKSVLKNAWYWINKIQGML